MEFKTVIVGVIIAVVILAVCWLVFFYKPPTCVEQRVFCYYSKTTYSVIPTITSDGNIAMTMLPTTTTIPLDCSDGAVNSRDVICLKWER